MVKLDDLTEAERDHIMAKELPVYETSPWVEGPPLRDRRVALVTTAGLHRLGDDNFSYVDLSYRGEAGPAQTATPRQTQEPALKHASQSKFRYRPQCGLARR